jgi:hypothetical protein
MGTLCKRHVEEFDGDIPAHTTTTSTPHECDLYTEDPNVCDETKAN